MTNAPALVSKLWNYCNILRDDGLSFRLRMASTRHDGDLASHAPLVCYPGELRASRTAVVEQPALEGKL
jgi:hypothetical protein